MMRICFVMCWKNIYIVEIIWDFGLEHKCSDSLLGKPFPQDRKCRQFELSSPRNSTRPGDKRRATSVRTPLAVHAHSATGRGIWEGQHQPWDGRKHAWWYTCWEEPYFGQLVVAAITYVRSCGNEIDWQANQGIYSPDQSPKLQFMLRTKVRTYLAR